LLARLLRVFETDYNRFLRDGSSSVTERFTQISSYAVGKKVRVTNGNETYVGVTAGLRPEGLLQVQREDGAVVTVLTGDVAEIR
jgi:biotin-(acetyl-CoA carboxylase) ligase